MGGPRHAGRGKPEPCLIYKHTGDIVHIKGHVLGIARARVSGGTAPRRERKARAVPDFNTYRRRRTRVGHYLGIARAHVSGGTAPRRERIARAVPDFNT